MIFHIYYTFGSSKAVWDAIVEAKDLKEARTKVAKSIGYTCGTKIQIVTYKVYDK